MADAIVARGGVLLVPTAKGFAATARRELNGPLGDAGRDGSRSYAGEFEREGKRGFASVGRSVGGAFVGAFAAIGASQLVSGMVSVIGDSVNAASDLGESVNALNVTFGDASAGIQEIGKTAATSFGLSKREFNGFAVQFSAFATTIAGDGGDVAGVLRDLTGRSADFASVMNLEVNEAMGLFQSGLAGETEPLRRFGIDLSAAAVEAYAYANGIAKTGEELTEAEKVQARYGLLMQSTAKTQGDFSNTSGEIANQQRILAASFEDAKAKLGEGLIPVATQFVKMLNEEGVPALERFAVWVGENEDMITSLGVTFAQFAVGSIEGLLRLGQVFGTVQTFWISAFSLMTRAAMDAFGAILDGATSAFGWVPGVGDKLRAAQTGFAEFQREAETKLGAAEAASRDLTAQLGQGADAAGNLRRELETFKPEYRTRMMVEGVNVGGAPGNIRFGGLARAAGGPVWPGEPFLVGEKGPEVVTFDKPGYVHDAKATQQALGGGGPLVHIDRYESAGDPEEVGNAVLWAHMRVV